MYWNEFDVLLTHLLISMYLLPCFTVCFLFLCYVYVLISFISFMLFWSYVLLLSSNRLYPLPTMICLFPWITKSTQATITCFPWPTMAYRETACHLESHTDLLVQVKHISIIVVQIVCLHKHLFLITLNTNWNWIWPW